MSQPIPIEILEIIIAYTPKKALKHVRLVNKALKDLCTPYLFDTLHVDALIWRLYGAARRLEKSPAIGKSVVNLIYDRRPVSHIATCTHTIFSVLVTPLEMMVVWMLLTQPRLPYSRTRSLNPLGI